MDKFLTFEGLQPMWLGDFDFMQEAVGSTLKNLVRAMTGYDSVILSGCEVSVSGSSVQEATYAWTDGVVALDGEILPIKSGSISIRIPQLPNIYFHVQKSYPQEGERIFKDGQSHNCYEKREAVLTTVLSKWRYSSEFPRMNTGEKKLATFVSDVSGVSMAGKITRKNGAYHITASFRTTTAVTSILADNVNIVLEDKDKSALLSGSINAGKTYCPLALSQPIEIGNIGGYVVPLVISLSSSDDGVSMKMQIAPDLPELGVLLPAGVQSTFETRLNAI